MKDLPPTLFDDPFFHELDSSPPRAVELLPKPTAGAMLHQQDSFLSSTPFNLIAPRREAGLGRASSFGSYGQSFCKRTLAEIWDGPDPATIVLPPDDVKPKEAPEELKDDECTNRSTFGGSSSPNSIAATVLNAESLSFHEEAMPSIQEEPKRLFSDQLVVPSPRRLTPAQRAQKVARYLAKKQRRRWLKKVQYQSRKRVADVRPRFKGRFVSEENAKELYEEYWRELCEKHKTERHFACLKVDRRTGSVLQAKFPKHGYMEKNLKRVLEPLTLDPTFKLRISTELGWKDSQP